MYYPDVLVACGAQDELSQFAVAPCLVVEVTSPITARTDRREKLDRYRALPTLRAYLVVDQHRRRVTRHWREADGAWRQAEATGDDVVPVPCPESELPLDIIYEDVTLPPLGVAERPADEEW